MSTLAGAPVVLASASPTRAKLLREAGLIIEVEPASVDEESIRDGMAAEKALPQDIAQTLAEVKAERVSRHRPGLLVIGADQILSCEGRLFAKPGSRDAAAAQLRTLSGKIHVLSTAVCVARDGAILWHHVGTAKLAMRKLSDEFLASYLDAAGDMIFRNVGAYALEGLGAQLFSEITGDYFTILGLPLLPLLDFLRGHHIVLG